MESPLCGGYVLVGYENLLFLTNIWPYLQKGHSYYGRVISVVCDLSVHDIADDLGLPPEVI